MSARDLTYEELLEEERRYDREVLGIADDSDLLDAVLEALLRYVVFPNEASAHAVTLWIAATHAQRAWQHATRLVVKSPEKRCGKSRLLDLIEALSHRPLVTVNVSVSAIFRSIDVDDPPTLIVDEADSIFGRKSVESTEELRGLFNAGFQRNRPTLRCVGPQQKPTEFATFAMLALAAIGDVIPDTITDRAVSVTMARRSPGESVHSFRLRRDAEPLRNLGKNLGAWVAKNLKVLEQAEPDLPVDDRAGDVWEPLIAIGDLAGQVWGQRARRASLALTAEADTAAAEESLGTRLLADLQGIVNGTAGSCLSSADLVAALRKLVESPWDHFEFSQNDLARKLKPYGIRPEQVRPDGPSGKQVRGYAFEKLIDAFTRYLPSQGVTPSQVQVSPVTPEARVTPQPVTEAKGVTALTRESDAVTVCDAHDRARLRCVEGID